MGIRWLLNRRVLLAGILIYIFQAVAFVGIQIGEVGFGQFQLQNKEYNQLVESVKDLPLEEGITKINMQAKESSTTSLSLLSEKLTYLSEYPQSITTILENKQKVEAFSIFQEKDSFTYKNILKTADDFSRMKDVTLALDKDRVTEHMIENNYLSFFVFAFVVYIIYEILKERESGMLYVTHTMKKGRFHLAFHRGINLIILTFLFYTICFVTNLVIACMFYGVDNFGGHIQTIQEYAQYPVVCSKGMYLFLLLWKSGFALSVMVMVTYFVFTIIRSRNLSVVIMLIILSVEAQLIKIIPVYSNLKLLRYVNLMRIFDCATFDKEYTNLSIFGNVVSASTLFLFVQMILIVAAFIGTVFVYDRQYPKQGYLSLKKILKPIECMMQKWLDQLSFCGKELYKVLITQKGIVMIGFGIGVFLWIFGKTEVHFPSMQKEMDQIYSDYGGSDWDKFDTYVANLEREREELITKAEAIMDDVREGKVGGEKVEEANNISKKAERIKFYLKEFYEKIELRQQIEERYHINIYMMSDRGYNEIIGSNSIFRETVMMIVLVGVCVIVISHIFNMEKKSHIIPLLKSSKRGVIWIKKRKIICGLALASILFIGLYGGNMWMLIKIYGLPYITAPIQSLTFLSDNNASVTIGMYLAIVISFKLAILCLATTTTLYFSSSKKVTNTMYIPLIIIGVSTLYIIIAFAQIIWLLVFISGLSMGISIINIWCSYKGWCM